MLNFDPIEEARANWVRHGWGDGTAMVAATSITRAHQIVLAKINAALAPHGLTFSRFELLALLFFSKAHELPLGKIGARLQVHPTSVTSLVDRLVADALVERVPHPTDRRTTLARLTQVGASLVAVCSAELEAIDFGLGSLDAEQQERVSGVITDLRDASGDWDSTG
ncbi:MAG: MarR family transcriptional regulator [Actinomycetota bacterium]